VVTNSALAGALEHLFARFSWQVEIDNEQIRAGLTTGLHLFDELYGFFAVDRDYQFAVDLMLFKCFTDQPDVGRVIFDEKNLAGRLVGGGLSFRSRPGG
jgi:hypothetical protein